MGASLVLGQNMATEEQISASLELIQALKTSARPESDERTYERFLQKIVNNLSIAGREMVLQGYWQQGLSTLQDCLGQALKLKDFPLYAETSYEVGRAHEMLSDWVNARLYYRDSLRHFTNLQNTSGQAKCHQGLGAVLISQGYREKGLDELRQAVKLYQTLSDEQGKAQVNQLIAAVGKNQPQDLLELTP